MIVCFCLRLFDSLQRRVSRRVPFLGYCVVRFPLFQYFSCQCSECLAIFVGSQVFLVWMDRIFLRHELAITFIDREWFVLGYMTFLLDWAVLLLISYSLGIQCYPVRYYF